ncbi:chemotaxis protein CheW [Cyanothece sp. BG0011]|uniref:chemotaxis protein CheW n=1 Tax=Cyanothece sp. BG0011 TaxID=2082950 RepID=UPI0018E52D5A|nr:chemotaxis protein CheW [Cyanothece sp. BG0011]
MVTTQALSNQRIIGDPYLHLQINSQTQILLPMTMTKEVLIIASSRLTIMPNMPPFFLGLLNQRSRIFWVVDLAKLLNISSLKLDSQQYSIAIIHSGKKALALAVEKVMGVSRFSKDRIESPLNTVKPDLIPYLQGCILDEKQLFFMVDPEAILNAPLLSR